MENELSSDLLTPDEAKTYSTILEVASQLPKNDPRYLYVTCFSWFLLHRRRRQELLRVKRRQFYKRWRRVYLLRQQMHKSLMSLNKRMNEHNAAALEESEYQSERRPSTSTVNNSYNYTKKEHLTENLWTRIESGVMKNSEFRQVFHMSKETFEFIYSELEEHLNKPHPTIKQQPLLHGKKRLCAALHRLATNAEFLNIANAFGIGKSTSLMRDICELIVTNLKHKYLSFSPGSIETKEELEKRVRESEKEFDIANCVGVLGSSDVLILGSSWNLSESSPYTSLYSKTFALVFQAVVNSRGQFSNVSAGAPAGYPNSVVLQKSKLEETMKEKFDGLEKIVDSIKVPVVLVGYDSSFGPSQSWLVSPYEGEELEGTPEDREVKEKFNKKIYRAKSSFDTTILNLRSRFKIIHGKNGKIKFLSDERTFENIANTCAILHNICQLKNDPMDPDWVDGIGDQLFIRTSQHNPTSDQLDEVETGEQQMEGDYEEEEGGENVNMAIYDDDDDLPMQEDMAENIAAAAAEVRRALADPTIANEDFNDEFDEEEDE